MSTKRARYQQGTIDKVPRANGWAWRVRFSEVAGGKRRQRALYFSGQEYPKEADVRKAIEMTVTQHNQDSERAKVDVLFGAVTGLYRTEHLPDLEPSTRQLHTYLLNNYIEPKFAKVAIRKVDPLAVTLWFGELNLAPTTKASIRSVLSQCFKLAALHKYISAMEKNPMSVVTIKGTSKRQKKIRQLTIPDFKRIIEALPEPLNVMTLVAGGLGLRVSELVALQWRGISWKDKQISIQRKFTRGPLGQTKTVASDALLPLDDGMLQVLARWKPKTGDSE